MKTPIWDFVRSYGDSGIQRLHMPGHKGRGPLGFERFDITEITGADDLSAPDGIIEESERYAGELFDSRHTFYSTGGSSQCIKAMLYLALLHRKPGTDLRILAGRNAHKAFIQGCGLLGLEPVWLWPEKRDSLCACEISPEGLRKALEQEKTPPLAVYITAPDYLGGSPDMGALAQVCREAGVPLLVDNAHGAYLRFLPEALKARGFRHPLELGASMCTDSAHKTLPVLTGGAYLHIAKGAEAPYEAEARQALALFGSSSPSYLILSSLDACNGALAGKLPDRISACAEALTELKEELLARGIPVRPGEPLKLTVDAAAMGHGGEELADLLREQGVEPEFADRDFLVLMFSGDTEEAAFRAVRKALLGIVPGKARPHLSLPEGGWAVMSLREAMLAPQETVPVSLAAGRICGGITVSCPPAIPIVVPGELISQEAAERLRQYGHERIPVLLS